MVSPIALLAGVVLSLHLTLAQQVAPLIQPREITLRVVKTARTETELTTLVVNNGMSARDVMYIRDPNTRSMVRLDTTNNRARVILIASLERETVPSTRQLFVEATASGRTATSTINVNIVNPVSQILAGLNTTGLIENPPDVQTVMSNVAKLTQSLCDVYTNQSPASTSLSRFRLFCLMFEAVYKNLPDSIFPDEPPTFNEPPRFVLSQMTFQVTENSPAGTLVGGLSATDNDGPSQLTFGAADRTTASLIRLDGASGDNSNTRSVNIYLTRSLDREQSSRRTLYVTASDGSATTTASVLLEVLDVNDNSPSFTSSSYRFTVHSDLGVGGNVGYVTATDADVGRNADITYSWMGFNTEEERLLRILPSGTIILGGDLRGMVDRTLTVIVKATDGGGRISTASVRIFVTGNSSADCRSSPCLNGGTCEQNSQPGYRCQCRPGFYGDQCQNGGSSNSSSCVVTGCENFGSCLYINGTYACYCPDRYYGSRCQYRNATVDCRTQMCYNGGNCSRTFNGSFACSCRPGFYGQRCEYARNTTIDCRTQGCYNEGTCIRSFNGSSVCYCRPGFFGQRCEYRGNSTFDCITQRCYNGGNCSRTFNGSFACSCRPGFYGQRCEYSGNSTVDCRTQMCYNGGNCSRTFNGSFACSCRPGFYGQRCEYSRNSTVDCRRQGCLNGGNCSTTFNGSFVCSCRPGFYGQRCEYSRNTTIDCRTQGCYNGGTCIRTFNGSSVCYCRPGFSGQRCEYSRNSTVDCRRQGCLNGGNCSRTFNGSFVCSCRPGFYGQRCEYGRNTTVDCRRQGCMNGGNCSRTFNGSFTCSCRPGFYGQRCEYGRNTTFDCRTQMCYNGGNCSTTFNGSFTCSCRPGFYGQRCEYGRNTTFDCRTQMCYNGGNCSTTFNGSFACSCRPGFYGQRCEYSGNSTVDCRRQGCMSGGNCSRTFNGSFACSCRPGFYGQRCEYTGNSTVDCRRQGCLNGGNCSRTFNGSFACSCRPGFYGQRCEYGRNTTFDCRSQMCYNGGNCSTTFNGSFACSCRPGFYGQRCEYSGNSTVDCRRQGCMNGGNCSTTFNGSFACSCRPEFYGQRCEYTGNSTLDCRRQGCMNGGNCSRTFNGSFVCSCRPGFYGQSCEYGRNTTFDCRSQMCYNGGNCSRTFNGSFVCSCRPGFYGQRCEYGRNTTVDCRTQMCYNGGTCISSFNGSYACSCRPGFYGQRCEYSGNSTVDCRRQGCMNGGNCSRTFNGSFACSCRPGFYGQRCEYGRNVTVDCRTQGCYNGGNCSRSFNGSFSCTCRPGFTGPRCASRDVGIRFRRSVISVNVSESRNPGYLTTVIVESDNGTSGMYMITNDTRDIITVTPVNARAGSVATWNVQLYRRLDREARSRWAFLLTVIQGNRRVNSTLVINVLDVNDNQPIFTTRQYTASVDHDSVQSTPVIIVSARDADAGDNGKITYRIASVSTPGASFTIDNKTGEITVNGSLLTLVGQTVNVGVMAMDGGRPPMQSQAMVYITIRRGNSLIKFATRVSVVSLNRTSTTGSLIAQLPIGPVFSGRSVSVSSNDTQGVLTLRVSQSQNQAIASVFLASSLNRTQFAQMNFQIRATDGVNSASMTLVVNITSNNNNNTRAPSFFRPNAVIDLDVDTVVGRVVHTVFASGSGNRTLFYNILNQNSTIPFFVITRNSGQIRLIRQLERRNTNITLRIRVTDNGIPQQQAVTNVTFIIHSDEGCFRNPCVNGRCGSNGECICFSGFTGIRCEREASLRFRQSSFNVEVSENSPIGSGLLVLQVDDSLSPSVGQIYLTNNDTRSFLRFVPISSSASATWNVTLNRPMDREVFPLWRVRVTATLGNRSTNASILLNVTDVNDNAPRFNQTSYSASFDSDAVEGTAILKVRAFDFDTGNNGSVNYRLVDNRFRIDETGTLYLSSSQNFFVGQSFSIIVYATDGGEPPMTSEAIVYLTVRQGDGRLRFPSPSTTVRVSEGVPSGSVLLEQAIGPLTLGRSLRVYSNDTSSTISLRQVNTGGAARITVFITRQLDREVTDHLVFRITADDGVTKANMTLLLNITDVNDNYPAFLVPQQSMDVSRYTPIRRVFGKVNAMDIDAGENGTVTYNITGGSPGYNYVGINHTTGALYILRPLSTVSANVVNLNIVAMDGGMPRLTANGFVSLRLTNTNVSGNTSRYAVERRVINVTENSPVGWELYRFTLNPERNISVKVNDSRLRVALTLRPGLATIVTYVNTIFDREQNKQVAFNISTYNNTHTLSTVLIVNILDVNDNIPVFTDSGPSVLNVNRATSPGALIATINATDADAGRNGTVTFSMANGGNFFNISENGRLYVASSLANISSISISGMVIMAQDGGNPPRRNYRSYTIQLTSEANTAPVFLRNIVQLRVNASTPVNTILTNLTAFDLDGPGSIQFSILPSNDSDYIFLGPSTGSGSAGYNVNLYLRRSLSNHNSTFMTFRIRAFDGITNTTAVVNMTVLRNTTNGTIGFLSSSYRIVVSSGAAVGTGLLMVTARPPPGQTVTYFITGPTPSLTNLFSMNSTTGSITVRQSLAAYAGANTTLRAIAQMSGNPNYPHFAPVFVVISGNRTNVTSPLTFASGRYNFTVVNNNQIGAVLGEIVLTVANSTFRGRTVTFRDPTNTVYANPVSILDTRTTVNIRLNRPLTANTVIRVNLTATLGNDATRTAMATINILLREEDDPTPLAIFTQSAYSFNIAENNANNSVVGTLSASHVDGGSTIIMLLPFSETRRFRLGTPSNIGRSQTIQLLASTSFDRENASRHSFTVYAVSGLRTATTQVTVQVIDRNDNAPQFSNNTYYLRLAETTPSTWVLSPQVVDRDSGNNGQMVFSKQVSTSPDLSTPFMVERSSGRVLLASSLEALAGQRVQFNIVASDSGTPSLSSTATVQIDVVSAVDSTAPVFRGIPATLNVTENTPIGQRLFIATVVDTDGPTRPQLRLPTDDRESFDTVTLGASFGNATHTFVQVNLKTYLNREAAAFKVFRLVASDGEKTVTSTTTILIGDQNDNAPLFIRNTYNFNVAKNAPEGTQLGAVAATDPDQGDSGRIRYTILESNANGIFRVDTTSGQIRSVEPIPLSVGQTIYLRIEARDAGTPSLNASVLVNILIGFSTVPQPDNVAPRFMRENYDFRVTENGQNNTMIGMVSVEDESPSLTFQVESAGPYPAPVYVSQTVRTGNIWMGVITTRTLLDREAREVYNFTVTANDGAATGLTSGSLTVNDLNDNRPVFQQTSYARQISRTMGAFTQVLKVTATDADKGMFGTITYTMQPLVESDGGFFVIDPPTGNIRTAQPMQNYPAGGSEIVLIVSATDNGQLESESVSAEVKITLI